jgi:hypothetical protein
MNNEPEAMPLSTEPLPGPYNAGLMYARREYDGVLVRLLSPLGDYPIGTVNHNEAAMVIRPDLSAMITSFKKIEEPEDYYSEIDYLSPFETRSLASILLSLRGDLNYLGLYPAPYAMEIRDIGVDLSDVDTVKKLMDEFAEFVKRVPFFNNEIHKPPLIGGKPYSYDDGSRLEHERQPEIFRSIDVCDHLLIRGLGALIRAIMLEHFTEFFENSAMSLYVAMEASMEIVKEMLHADGNEKPTAKEAGRFLDRIFGCEYEAEGYFEAEWEDRIKIIHPASDFGVFPGAPIGVDDVYFLRRVLIHLYDFLVTGNVKEEMKWKPSTVGWVSVTTPAEQKKAAPKSRR